MPRTSNTGVCCHATRNQPGARRTNRNIRFAPLISITFSSSRLISSTRYRAGHPKDVKHNAPNQAGQHTTELSCIRGLRFRRAVGRRSDHRLRYIDVGARRTAAVLHRPAAGAHHVREHAAAILESMYELSCGRCPPRAHAGCQLSESRRAEGTELHESRDRRELRWSLGRAWQSRRQLPVPEAVARYALRRRADAAHGDRHVEPC